MCCVRNFSIFFAKLGKEQRFSSLVSYRDANQGCVVKLRRVSNLSSCDFNTMFYCCILARRGGMSCLTYYIYNMYNGVHEPEKINGKIKYQVYGSQSNEELLYQVPGS